MKLTQMIVQGLQEAKSPLLQLPHFEEEHLRYCISKKVTSESASGCRRRQRTFLNETRVSCKRLSSSFSSSSSPSTKFGRCRTW